MPMCTCKGRTLFWVALLVVAFAVASLAQTETATLSGRITDPSGAVVPGAEVEATNIDTGISVVTKTNEEGLYVIPHLRPGKYRLIVRKEGFQTVIKTDLVLNVQAIVAQNLSLQVGSVTQSVTVMGGAPLVNTDSGTVGTVVDRQFVENIPLNGRSFQTLIALTPGTVIVDTQFTDQGQFSINGQRANANYLTIDGVSANIGISTTRDPHQVSGGGLPGLSAAGGFNNLVSVDAMQEFRVQTSTYAPEFGRTPGGQIAITTRSGTNEFHGALFEYFRNDVLDANDWFANLNGLPKPPLRQNQFGGVVGGPIIKNRTFFFLSYEGLRLRLPQTKTGVLVPSVAVRQAAPAATKPLLDAFPLPNGAVFPNGTAEVSATYSDPSTLDATSIRIDHALNTKVNLFGRYAHSTSDTKQRQLGLSPRNVTAINTKTLTLGAAWAVASRISNDFRANFSWNDGKGFTELDDFGGAVPPTDSAVFPASRSRQDSSLNVLVFSFPAPLVLGRLADNVQRQFNLVDSLSVIAGPHHVKFGVDYRRLSPRIGSGYTLVAGFLDLSASPGGALSGDAFFYFINAQDDVTLLLQNFSSYAQDTWRIGPRLTLTYGLRWEVNPAPKGADKPLFTFDNIDDLTMLSVAPEGTSLYETTYGNVAPRVGLAYQLSTKQGWELVLRGGFGTFYDLGSGMLANTLTFPYRRFTFPPAGPFPLSAQDAEPVPISLNPPFSGTFADRDLKLPYTYQWNVSLEQALGANHTVSASYVAAVGRRLLRRERSTGGLSSDFSTIRNSATSDYHALQLQSQRRLSQGLQALASCTWSHSLDIGSSDTLSSIPGSFTDPDIDRGSSDFDIRHSFSGALTYDIPPPHFGRFGRAVLGDWSVDTIFFARTAPPVDVVGTSAFVGFIASLRPDVVPGQPLYLFGPQYPGGKAFNPAAFSAPTGNQHGNLGRNVVRGFGAWQLDFALRRQFSLTERVNLQFRTEFFNIFNHPNFGAPSNFLASSLFGLSQEMLGRSLGTGGSSGGFNPLYQIGGSRSIQFALRLGF